MKNVFILYTAKIEETTNNFGGCYAGVMPLATGMNLNVANGFQGIIGLKSENIMSAYIMYTKKEAEEKARGLNRLYKSKGNYYYNNWKD